MPKYLIQANYTPEGFNALKRDGAASRIDAVSKALASVGGKLESLYFTFGKHDVIIVCECPDNVSAIALASAACSSGQVRTTTTPLLTAAELDQAFAKGVTYRPPGS